MLWGLESCKNFGVDTCGCQRKNNTNKTARVLKMQIVLDLEYVWTFNYDNLKKI